MLNYKLNITEIPTYNDGFFNLYKIFHTESSFPVERIKIDEEGDFYYNELSLSDDIIFENDKREKKIKLKIRIPQNRGITSLNVLKIDGNYYQVFNIYHFKNKDGYLESDITLQEYPNPKIMEDKNV